MPAGQAFIDLLANTAITFDGNRPRPFIVDPKTLRALAAPEQAGLINTGQGQRTDQGIMRLFPLGGGPAQPVPTIIVLGTDGTAKGGHGQGAVLFRPHLHGHILIAIGGNGIPIKPGPSDGGDAICIGGGGDGLTVALGGTGADGAKAVGVGGDGNDGGSGGRAAAVALSDGAVIFAQGGGGGRVSEGNPGAAGPPLVMAGNPGTLDGAGGDAWAGGLDFSTLIALGGEAINPPPGGGAGPIAGMPPPGPPPLWRFGFATVSHGPQGCEVSCKNGDGNKGTIQVN